MRTKYDAEEIMAFIYMSFILIATIVLMFL